MTQQLIATDSLFEAPDNSLASKELSAQYAFQPTEFLEWNYDQERVTEWLRQGDCNGCGDCCQAVIKVQTAGNRLGYGQWEGPKTDGHGKWNSASDGEKVYFFKTAEMQPPLQGHKCPEFGEDGRCRVHEIKPVLCRVWPVAPEQVAAYPRCSYTFERGRTWGLHAEWSVGPDITAQVTLENTKIVLPEFPTQ